jgi:PST family polysaccharide transporter
MQGAIANTAWLFADKVLRLLIGLGVGIWIANYLGPEKFGLLNYATAFVSLFATFATLGIDGLVIRELVQDSRRKDEVLGTAFAAKLTGGFVTAALAMLGIVLVRREDSTVHGLVAIVAAGVILQAFDVIDFWFQSRVESRFVVTSKASVFLLISIAKILLVINGAPLFAFALAATAEILFGAVALILAYRFNGQRLFDWSIRFGHVRDLLRQSWPVALTSMAIMVYMKIDLIMLGQMLGNRSVGVYSAAIRFSEVWYFIPVAIVASVSPSLIVARNVDMDLYYKRIGRLFKLLMWISLAIAIPMTFASQILASVAYGNRYEGVAPVLAIHIWALPFVSLGVAQNPWNLNEGLTRLALARAIFGAFVNVGMNFLLIPAYGAIGAAIATTVSYALTGCFLNAFDSRTRRIFRLQMETLNVLLFKKAL